MIQIYRREIVGTPAKKMTKADIIAKEASMIACRVRRPGLEAIFNSGEFRKLTALPQTVIDSPMARYSVVQESTKPVTITLPADSLGRVQRDPDENSTRQSVLLWVKKWYPELAADVSLTVE